MLKPQELRIGNYVYAKGEIEVVTDVLSCGINQHHDYWHFDYSDLEPIPLSEEILLKCGFSWCESKVIGKPKILTIQISNNETLDLEDDEFFIANVGSHKVVTLWKSPRFLHQLQNLFFSLTGEELIVNI